MAGVQPISLVDTDRPISLRSARMDGPMTRTTAAPREIYMVSMAHGPTGLQAPIAEPNCLLDYLGCWLNLRFSWRLDICSGLWSSLPSGNAQEKTLRSESWLTLSGVAVEKSPFSSKQRKFGG